MIPDRHKSVIGLSGLILAFSLLLLGWLLWYFYTGLGGPQELVSRLLPMALVLQILVKYRDEPLYPWLPARANDLIVAIYIGICAYSFYHFWYEYEQIAIWRQGSYTVQDFIVGLLMFLLVMELSLTFDIDANGILHVSAKDLGTGKQQAITITGHGGLEEKEIDRMVKDAEANASEDKKRRETIDARNHADQLVYSLEKLLRDNKDKVPSEEVEAVQREIDNTKKAIESDDVERIRKATEDLSRVSHKLTELMYRQAGPQPGSGPAAGGPQAGSEQRASGGDGRSAADGDVIDAEVVDEDKGRKS